jgi:hypothetical protein
MQGSHSALVTGFTARLPARPDRRPSPAAVAARGPSPPPGPAGMPPRRSQGQARMTLPAATAPDAEGRAPAPGTQL